MAFLARVLASATIASAASSFIAATLSERQGKGAAAPLNAVSHIVWGDGALLRDGASAKYTAAGLAINYAGCLAWASVLETWARYRPVRGIADAIGRGALLAAAAYAVDYHVVPARYSPGYERPLSSAGMACVYGALALGLPLRAWLTRTRRPDSPAGLQRR